MANDARIQFRGGVGIGVIGVDPSRVRGEAGPTNPQLVVPLSTRRFNQAGDEMLAVTGRGGRRVGTGDQR
ncbi:MAG TPA: hypothetical protein VNG12_13000 [Acidimicrobiales bacterium]|nr:hypothetical protein [Acidimicrobiales bacterium]